MAAPDKPPFFSIILSTRNRPELFEIAMQSVLDQTFPDKEIIVVIDGSTGANLEKYKALKTRYPGVEFLELEHRPNGHGQSYTMNFGTHRSSGRYLCYLDDDDKWIDNHYLERLFVSITASKLPVDVHYSNQNAVFADGTVQHEHVWIQDLIPKVNPQNRNHEDSYFVDAEFLLSSKGFAHLNCTVLNRDFFNALGGMDESIRYENDRDIYIRSIDRAKVILYSTRFMSLHNIPDVSKKDNMSTVNSDIDKKLYQLRVYDKGISFSARPSVVRACSKSKIYCLKQAANILAQNKRYASAAHFAMEALFIGFNFRWLTYTIYLVVKARLQPRNESRDSRQ
jgi:glycosyltransferase involved in cell wall biosynthesis